MLSTDKVKILMRLKYLFLIPLNDSVCITCIVFHAAVGWHGQLCTSTFAFSDNEFMITLILNNLIKIEALGASPSQPSPLTEDLN